MGLKKGEKTKVQLLEELEKYKNMYQEKDQKVISSQQYNKTVREELSNIIQLGKNNRDHFLSQSSHSDKTLSWMEIASAIGELKEKSNGVEGIFDRQRYQIEYLSGELDKLKNTKKE